MAKKLAPAGTFSTYNFYSRFMSTILSLIVFPAYAESSISVEAGIFFNRYITLSDNFDAAVVNLYSDNAVITTDRQYPQGFQRSLELSGAAYKKLIIESMPLSKLRNDKSTFDNIEISEIPGGAKITARRYSTIKCYYDGLYFMEIKKNPNNQFEIVKEHSSTQPQSDCSK
jgi:hypothetical protein